MSDVEQRAIVGKSVIDGALYAVKYIGGLSRIEMFVDDDNQKVGVTNVSGGKLEKGEPFACTGLVVLSGNYDGSPEDLSDLLRTDFGIIHPHLRNGHFKFMVNQNRLVADQLTNEVFVTHRIRSRVTRNDGTVVNALASGEGTAYVGGFSEMISNGEGRVGYYEFDNPIIIETQNRMDLVFEWGLAAPQGEYMKVILLGSKVK
jgi:hypothetical protein